MPKECHTFDHPADVGLRARADSLRELYEALAEGLADFLCLRQSVQPTQTRPIAVSAEDAEALAHDFLSAVLEEIQERHFMIASLALHSASEREVAGELCGEPYAPARHEIRTEVKAVTYHQLRIWQEGGAWLGTVILDL